MHIYIYMEARIRTKHTRFCLEKCVLYRYMNNTCVHTKTYIHIHIDTHHRSCSLPTTVTHLHIATHSTRNICASIPCFPSDETCECTLTHAETHTCISISYTYIYTRTQILQGKVSSSNVKWAKRYVCAYVGMYVCCFACVYVCCMYMQAHVNKHTYT